MRRTRFIAFLLFILVCCSVAARDVRLKIVETSDIHGNYFPYNFIEQRDWGGSLARVYSFVEEARKSYGDNLLLLDNGDILQGQPTAYYYNFIDTSATHLAADIMNFMRYNIGNMGNHDVEAGHAVYDRWISQCNFPVLGANMIRKSDGLPYLKPYQIIERDGVRIAVLGMITPAIPVWLPENLWEGITFEDMEVSAHKWMAILKNEEKADLIVGIFHSGKEGGIQTEAYKENASLAVARNVPGFDIVLFGHDHQRICEKIANTAGDSVLLIDPASNAQVVANVDVVVTLDGSGRIVGKQIAGTLVNMNEYEPGDLFMQRFASQFDDVKSFVSRKIGTFDDSITTRPAYFGPSAFVDFIHTLQLDISGADISLSAPLSFDARIDKGDVKISDMFNLYKFENLLYTMSLSGAEVKGALEESYAIWSNRMQSPDDRLLLLKPNERDPGRLGFVNYSFNFDSAAGIIYTVDVTKPAGQKVTIESMANGSPFLMDSMYRVAVNSYRGNGGGELLTKGAGITKDELQKRIISSTDKDLRFYLIKYIEEKKVLTPKCLHQWKFIPEAWTKPAAERDYKDLFH